MQLFFFHLHIKLYEQVYIRCEKSDDIRKTKNRKSSYVPKMTHCIHGVFVDYTICLFPEFLVAFVPN